jgi:hypothetical protein
LSQNLDIAPIASFAGRACRRGADVPARWSRRTGVCHNCETGLVDYRPDPVEPPAAGNLLICCSQREGDIVIDL